MKFHIKLLFYLFLILFSSKVLAQQPDSILRPAPPPPKVPIPKVNFSQEDLAFIDSIQQEVKMSHGNFLERVNQLSSIILDEKAFPKMRIKAIDLIAELPIQEAKLFLLENIDLFVYGRGISDRPYYRDNIPLYVKVTEKKEYDIHRFLFVEQQINECLNERKIELYAFLYHGRYGKNLSLAIVEHQLKFFKTDCAKQNIQGLLNRMKRLSSYLD